MFCFNCYILTILFLSFAYVICFRLSFCVCLLLDGQRLRFGFLFSIRNGDFGCGDREERFLTGHGGFEAPKFGPAFGGSVR